MSHQPPVQWEVNLIALVNTVQLQHTVLEITNVKTEATRQKMKREKAKKGERGKVNHEYNLFRTCSTANLQQR